MNKTDRINLRAKTALNKLNGHNSPWHWHSKVWEGIMKVSKDRPYQVSDKDFEEALNGMEDFL